VGGKRWLPTHNPRNNARSLETQQGQGQGQENFLRSYKDQFLEAQESGDVGKFYSLVTRAFILAYGWDLPLEQDGTAEEVTDASAASPLDYSDVDDVEVERRREMYNVLKKLQCWYRYQYKAVNSSESTKGSVQEILDVFQEMSVTRPRKQQAVQAYSNRFYKDKLKTDFDEAWNKVKGTVPAATRISMCNDYVREAWNKEPEEVRKGIEEETEKTFKEEMEAYKNGKAWMPRTAEEYQQ